LGAPSNQENKSDFSPRWCILYNSHGRAIGPRLGLSGGSWPILLPWKDMSQRRFLQNQVPKKQLVWTCQAGPSTSRGLVNTWWSQTWHSLSRTRRARHGLHAPRGMQSCKPGLLVYTWFVQFTQQIMLTFAHSLHTVYTPYPSM
jgi:hypothetical protein